MDSEGFEHDRQSRSVNLNLLNSNLNLTNQFLIGYRKQNRGSVGFEPFYKVGPVIFLLNITNILI